MYGAFSGMYAGIFGPCSQRSRFAYPILQPQTSIGTCADSPSPARVSRRSISYRHFATGNLCRVLVCIEEAEQAPLTKGNHDPDEVHKKVINPKVITLWPTVRHSVGVVIKQARRIIQRISIQVTHADDYLQWMPKGVLGEDQVCHQVAEWTPDELRDI